jgi:hypothetical protein
VTRRHALEQLGFDLRQLSDQQIELLESLDDAEFALLARIKGKLDDLGDDVEGHALDGGGVVW